MVKIFLEIKSCSDCPHFLSERRYTSDDFETMFDWFCKKADNKVIRSFVECGEEKDIKIPKWCPAR